MAEQSKTYEYDAFISYRTTMIPDRPAAEAIEKILETYPVPFMFRRELVKRSWWRPRIRVFRDIHELNATPNLKEEIQQKLRESKFLIVVVSPNTISSFCEAEIEYFAENSDKSKILFVIVKGDPKELLPKLAPKDDRQNPESDIPLAADVRGEDTKAIVDKIRGRKIAKSTQAKFKLISPLLGCESPDELIVRDKNRVRRSLATRASIVYSAVLLFCISIWTILCYQNVVDIAKSKLNVSPESSLLIAKKATEFYTSQELDLVLRNAVANSRAVDQLELDSIASGVYSADEKVLIESSDGLLTWDMRADTTDLFKIEKGTQIVQIDSTSMTMTTRNEEGLFELWDIVKKERLNEIGPYSYPNEGESDHPSQRSDWSRALTAKTRSDGRKMLTNDGSSEILVWNLSDQSKYVVETSVPSPLTAISEDGTRFAAECSGNRVKIFGFDSPKLPISLLEGHKKDINDIVFSSSGTLIATSSDDKTVRVWDTSNGSEKFTLKHTASVEKAIFSPDEKFLVTVGRDEIAILWDLESGMRLFEMEHRGKICDVVFDQHGNRIASIGYRSINIWDVHTFENLARLGESYRNTLNNAPDIETFFGAAFHDDEKTLITASDVDGYKIRKWDVERRVKGLTLDSKRFTNFAIDPVGKTLAATASNSNTYIFSLSDGRLRNRLGLGPVNDIAFSSDGKLIATASMEENVRVWDANTGKPEKTLTIGAGAVSFNNENNLLLCIGVGKQGSVVFDLDSEASYTLPSTRHHLCGALSPDGKFATFGTQDGYVEIYDFNTQEILHELKLEGGAVGLDFSRNGLLAIAGEELVTINLEPLSGSRHANANLMDIDFNQDGTLLAAVGEGSPVVFDVRAKKVIEKLEGYDHEFSSSMTANILRAGRNPYSGDVLKVSFGPNDNCIITVSNDGQVRVHPREMYCSENELQNLVEKRTARELNEAELRAYRIFPDNFLLFLALIPVGIFTVIFLSASDFDNFLNS